MSGFRYDPCEHCPFRKDVVGFLHHDRAVEIADTLLNDESFQCHETIEFDDDTGRGIPTQKSLHCAGASLFLEAQKRPNQMMRIGERLGIYRRENLRQDIPCFTSKEEFVGHMEGRRRALR